MGDIPTTYIQLTCGLINIFLPKSWQIHGQARIMMIDKEELQLKIRDSVIQKNDLPSSLEGYLV